MNAKTVAKAMTGPVNTLLLATAYAQAERERVDKIQRKVLADQNYYYAECHGRRGRITEPKDAWLMDNGSAEAYYGKLNAIHVANGYEDAAQGYCPALVAETLQTQAEWAVIEAAEQFFPGVTNDRLLCGTQTEGGLETRRKYLDLMIGLVVNAPGYRKPAMPTT